MWPYLLLFFITAYCSLFKEGLTVPHTNNTWSYGWIFIFILLVLMIGLRHEVGGDWGNYIGNFELYSNLTFEDVFFVLHGDVGDRFVSWCISEIGGDIYFLNTIYAFIFTFGLLKFCKLQPRPWLALTVAVPYLITVVAMGYTRQSVALGLVMLAILSLEKNNFFKFILIIVVSSSFHKSAFIFLPLALFVNSKNRFLSFVFLLIILLIIYTLFIEQNLNFVYTHYIEEEYSSSGAFVRVSMCVLPAFLFLFFNKSFILVDSALKLWKILSLCAFGFMIALFFSLSSTLVDRLALYILPLQLLVFSRLPNILSSCYKISQKFVTLLIVIYSGIVHFVWLVFADHSIYWQPYLFYPFVNIL